MDKNSWIIPKPSKPKKRGKREAADARNEKHIEISYNPCHHDGF